MRILRDESGHVLVLRSPRLALVGKADEREQGTGPSDTPVAAVPTASCALPHCCFYCRWCGEPILLPHDRIGLPFGNPDARKIEARSIATVCSKCKHIGNYTMFRGSRGFDTRHKIVLARSSGTTMLLNWLQCEEKTCAARVPLFVRFEQDPQDEAAQVSEWLWDELTCALGHRIEPIPLDSTLQLPFRNS